MSWLAACFREFDIFLTIGTLFLYAHVESDRNRENVLRSLVGTKSEPFRLRFAYFSPNISRIQYMQLDCLSVTSWDLVGASS